MKSSSCDKCDTHSPGKDSLLVKDETFPELVAGGDDAESVCSCAERDRDGDAFPKAFERDLVTPTNLSTDVDNESAMTDRDHEHDSSGEVRTAEERRKSMLDHHWAIPSKDRSLEGDDTPPRYGYFNVRFISLSDLNLGQPTYIFLYLEIFIAVPNKT